MVSGAASLATSLTLGYLLSFSLPPTTPDFLLPNTTLYTLPPNTSHYIMMSYYLSSFTVRSSTWINLVLSLVRSVHIMTPHVKVRWSYVVTPILIISLLIICVMILDQLAESDVGEPTIWHRIRFNFIFSMTGRRICLYIARKLCVVISKETMWTVCIILPFVVPAVVSMVAMVTQVYFMVLKPGVSRKTNRKISTTIIYLTSVYVVVNTSYFLCTLMYLYLEQEMSPGMSSALFVTSNILPYISSLINPLIITLRGKSVRQHFTTVMTCKLLGSVLCCKPVSSTQSRIVRCKVLTRTEFRDWIDKKRNNTTKSRKASFTEDNMQMTENHNLME